MNRDCIDILKDVLLTAFGVGLGIVGALWQERRNSGQRRKQEETHLLTAIGLNLKHNIELMDQLKKGLSLTTSDTPTYHMDLSPWQAYSGRLDSIEDVQLLRKITATYYELEHLNRKVNALFDLHYSMIRTNQVWYDNERKLLVKPILAQMEDPLLSLANETLALINTELSKRGEPLRTDA
jgi:hypothetical protein